MGTPVGRVLVQCRRVRWHDVPARGLYRWDTEIPASRSKRTSLNTRNARSINFLVPARHGAMQCIHVGLRGHIHGGETAEEAVRG